MRLQFVAHSKGLAKNAFYWKTILNISGSGLFFPDQTKIRDKPGI
jgi:hypothetical protein